MIDAADLARSEALHQLWAVLERATDTMQRTSVLDWLAARSEDEGGFLWLAGQLGCRPSVIETMIRATVEAPAKQRNFLRWRLRRLQKANG